MNKTPVFSKESHERLVSAYTARMLRERYSRQTMRNYRNYFIRFLQHCEDRDPATFNSDEVRAYIKSECERRPLAASTVNVLVYSLRFYYEQVLKQRFPVGTFRIN